MCNFALCFLTVFVTRKSLYQYDTMTCCYIMFGECAPTVICTVKSLMNIFFCYAGSHGNESTLCGPALWPRSSEGSARSHVRTSLWNSSLSFPWWLISFWFHACVSCGRNYLILIWWWFCLIMDTMSKQKFLFMFLATLSGTCPLKCNDFHSVRGGNVACVFPSLYRAEVDLEVF